MARLPERWLLAFFHLRRNSTLPKMPDTGAYAGNGNGNGNGSDHAPATPANILHQAIATRSNGDDDRRSKDARAPHTLIKPK
jgi:hypothetical protein